MKKFMAIILMVALAAIALTGCDQAARVSSNLSQEADSFNVTRRLIAFNQRTDTVVFIAVGNFSLEKEADGDLAIVGEDEGVLKLQYKIMYIFFEKKTVVQHGCRITRKT